MQIKDLILYPISIQVGELISEIQNKFVENGLDQIPFLKDGKYIGLIHIDQLEHMNGNEIFLPYQTEVNTFVNINDYIYQLWLKIAENKLSCIPVLNDAEEYLGIIKTNDLVKEYVSQYGLSPIGSTLIFKTKTSNYSESILFNILDEYRLHIEHYFIIQDKAQDELKVVSRLNGQTSEQLISDMQRHNLEVIMVYSTYQSNEPLKDRYDELMHYLNV